MESSLHPFIQNKVVVLRADSTVYQAARAMCENQVGCLMVADHFGHILGIVTDRDLICRAVARALGGHAAALQEVMTPAPVSVSENSSLTDVIEAMVSRGVRRIPVLRELSGGHQRCVGMVSLDDLLATEAIPSSQIGQIVRAQIRRRHKAVLQAQKIVEDAQASEFLTQVARETGVGEDEARSLARFLFSAITRRLHYTAAIQFISLLPQLFHLDLFDLPAGPDRSISARDIELGVEAHIRADQEGARQCLRRFWHILENSTDRARLNHIMHQLPEDIRILFREGSSYEAWSPQAR